MDYNQWIPYIIFASLGIILLGTLIDQAGLYTDPTKNTVVNESVVFGANNTCYGTLRGPVTSITAMYNDTAHSATYASSRYTLCDDGAGIKIYVNGTATAPNMTTGTRIVDYVIYKPTGMGGVIVGLMVAIFLTVLVLIYLGYIG